jgi:hypothetical protein
VSLPDINTALGDETVAFSNLENFNGLGVQLVSINLVKEVADVIYKGKLF